MVELGNEFIGVHFHWQFTYYLDSAGLHQDFRLAYFTYNPLYRINYVCMYVQSSTRFRERREYMSISACYCSLFRAHFIK